MDALRCAAQPAVSAGGERSEGTIPGCHGLIHRRRTPGFALLTSSLLQRVGRADRRILFGGISAADLEVTTYAECSASPTSPRSASSTANSPRPCSFPMFGPSESAGRLQSSSSPDSTARSNAVTRRTASATSHSFPSGLPGQG